MCVRPRTRDGPVRMASRGIRDGGSGSTRRPRASSAEVHGPVTPLGVSSERTPAMPLRPVVNVDQERRAVPPDSIAPPDAHERADGIRQDGIADRLQRGGGA